MGIIVPRFTNLQDPRERHVLNQLLIDLRQEAFNLALLDTDGGVGDQRKCTNLDASWVRYVSNATPSTEDAVTHGLGRTPQAAFVGMPDKAAVVFDTGTDWTDTQIFIAADVATVTVNILVI